LLHAGEEICYDYGKLRTAVSGDWTPFEALSDEITPWDEAAATGGPSPAILAFRQQQKPGD